MATPGGELPFVYLFGVEAKVPVNEQLRTPRHLFTLKQVRGGDGIGLVAALCQRCPMRSLLTPLKNFPDVQTCTNVEESITPMLGKGDFRR